MTFLGSEKDLLHLLIKAGFDVSLFDMGSGRWALVFKEGGRLSFNAATGALLLVCPPDRRPNLEAGLRKLFSEHSGSFATLPVRDKARPSPLETESPQEKMAPSVAASFAGPVANAAVQATSQYSGRLTGEFSESELVLGLVAAVGAKVSSVVNSLTSRLQAFGYKVVRISVSRDVIPQVTQTSVPNGSEREFDRISRLMNAGNNARKASQDSGILALGVAAKISEQRKTLTDGLPTKVAYIVDSIKRPEEVFKLRKIYAQGFYLIGVHEAEDRRRKELTESRRMSREEAASLMKRDESERDQFGQSTRNTFHLSDFFVLVDQNADRLASSLNRVLDILFSAPFVTPTFDEYAMFMAFSASLRSADLSRQVGAVVTKDCEIIATGANDCPKFGGGLYWPELDPSGTEIIDDRDGRDYMRGFDANVKEQRKIIGEIVEMVCVAIPDAERTILESALRSCAVHDITEYGRVVHAEMEALLSCARNPVSSRGADLYCTTFPCHNCAKHIVAAGIRRVVYVEPYPKSKAAELHDDSIELGFFHPDADIGKVVFEPFVGVGPRRFFDLFSLRLGSGSPIKRKDESGHIVNWSPEASELRVKMSPYSYQDLETAAAAVFDNQRRKESCDAPSQPS